MYDCVNNKSAVLNGFYLLLRQLFPLWDIINRGGITDCNGTQNLKKRQVTRVIQIQGC